MAKPVPSEPITVRTAKVAEIDALASAMDRSRNGIVNQKNEPSQEAKSWQMELIAEGVSATRDRKVIPAEDVFARIEAKHGWPA